MNLLSLILLKLVWSPTCGCSSESFSLSDEYPAGTKTAYATSQKFQDSSLYLYKNVPKDYTLTGLSALYRHGTRYPSSSKIQKWATLIYSVQNNATEDLPEWLEDWESQMDVDLAWLLNDVGWAELKGLASRFKSLNPEIFNSRRYSVKSSFKARCVSSARGFIAGLHPEEYSDFSTDMDHVDATERSVTYLETEIEINNRLLRFFDSCRRHVDWEESPRCENESRKFIAGGHVSSIRKEIARTLGLKYITNRQVVDLHQLVVFETALFGKSELKEFFRTEGAFEVLEYVSDLKHYYKTGYGYALNYRSATPLLDDMVGIIREMVENPDAKPRADLYFGHAETAVPLMALLGLFEGAPLTADSFVLARHRRFRCTKIAPFAANISFLLYKKNNPGSEEDTPGPDLVLQVAVNEHLVNIPGQHHTVDVHVALEYFEKKIKSWSQHECDVTKLNNEL